MSRTESPSTAKPYGLARVTAAWGLPRSTYYARRHRLNHPVESRKRGPRTAWTDEVLTERIREQIAASPFSGEGHRKVWARLRVAGIRSSKARVLRLMRQAQLLAPQRLAVPVVEKTHSGTITTDRPNRMWGIDATATVTLDDGQVTVFAAVDHCTAECVGIHAVKRATRFEALEPLRQGVRQHFGGFRGRGRRRTPTPARSRFAVHERRLPERTRLPGNRVVAGVCSRAGRQRLYRTLLQNAQGATAVGPALPVDTGTG